MRLTKTTAEHYREVADRYSRATGELEYEIIDAVRWGIDEGELDLSPQEEAEIHYIRMSEALRSHVTTDRHGNKVRLRHCVAVRDGRNGRPVERHLWSHLDDASDEFLMDSLMQRRNHIAADVQQLKFDLNFINDRRAQRGLRPIIMTFNFDEPDDFERELPEVGD